MNESENNITEADLKDSENNLTDVGVKDSEKFPTAAALTEPGKPFPKPVLSGSALKVIALLTMFVDHTAAFLAPFLPNFFYRELFSLGDSAVTVYVVMRLIGRVSFPLFAFLIAEGCFYTKNRVRYAVSLFVAALLSKHAFALVHLMLPGSERPLGDLVLQKKAFTFAMVQGSDYIPENVFFTLFFGCLGICLYDLLKKRPVIMACAVAAVGVLAWGFRADYGLAGYLVILLFYLLRDYMIAACIAACGMLGVMTLPAYPVMAFYNKERGFIRGPVLKYLFYALYPIHLYVLVMLQYILR